MSRTSKSHPTRSLALACLIGLGGPSTRADDPPTYREVEFRGREHVDLKDIEEATRLKKGAVADTVRARLALNQIRTIYQEKGFELVEVKLLEGGKEGDSRVIIDIIEGPWFEPAQVIASGSGDKARSMPPPVLAMDETLKAILPKADPDVFRASPPASSGFSVKDLFKSSDQKVSKPANQPSRTPPVYSPPSLVELNRSIAKDPTSADLYRARSDVFMAKEQYFRSIADLNQAIRLAPGRSTDYVRRGSAFCYLGQFDRGFADIDYGLALASCDPERVEGLRCRGACRERRLEYALAVKDFDRVIEIQSGQAYDLRFRGSCQYELGQFDHAIEDFEAAIRLEPSESDYVFLGACHFAKGDYAQAESSYVQALAIVPDCADCLVAVSRARMAQGQVDRAITDLDRLITTNAEAAGAFTARGWAYLAKRDLAKAKADFDRALDLLPCRATGYAIIQLVDATDLDNTSFDRPLATFEERSRDRPDLYGVMTSLEGDAAKCQEWPNPYFVVDFITRPFAGRWALSARCAAYYECDPWSRSASTGRAIVAILQGDRRKASDKLARALLMIGEMKAPGSSRPTLLELFRKWD